MVLVLETVGTVDEFFRAVRRIKGLEWLVELETQIDSDLDFHDPKDLKRPLQGSVYLVMTDQQALRNLLSLWNRWKAAPEKAFAKGWNRWRHLFQQLRNIRPWNAEDRLRETGLLEVWRERLAAGDADLRTEIELWPRQTSWTRDRAAAHVNGEIARLGGRVLTQAAIPEIAYHGVLAEIPATAAARILESRDVELVRCEEVMFFRPVGQMATPPAPGEVGPEAAAPPPPLSPTPAPIVALLDGMPLERHRLLDGRIVVDDPDGWAAEVPADKRHHGTGMASLILHGDLAAQESPLAAPIYVRPVLKPDSMGREAIPAEVLPVDFLHGAIRRLFRPDEGQGRGIAPEVQIVNLSIGDPWQQFDSRISPIARLLDWLAWEHKILIVASAGNHLEPIQIDAKIAELQATELQAAFWTAIRNRAHLQRLLAPAEGINVLTIGAEHHDACGTFELGPRLNPAVAGDDGIVPSPLTSWGPGPSRAIKPEVLFPGGRQLYREEPGNRLSIARASARKPGHQVASAHQSSTLSHTCFTVGTSNAGALGSRSAAQILDRLPALIAEFEERPHRRLIPPLLKALIVHGAAWGRAREFCDRLLGTTTRSEVGRFLGFGFADVDRVLGCTEQRVTLIAWGEVKKDVGDVYTIPLPYGLSGVKGARRLITTLSWLTPTNPRDRRYRQADLWVSIGDSDSGPSHRLGVTRTEADYHAAMRGTVHHEVWEGEEASIFAETDTLELQVNCREHAPRLGDNYIPYGLLVTLEVAPEVDVHVYDEVRARIGLRIPVITIT